MSDQIKALKFATEFLRIVYAIHKEAKRPDGLPEDIQNHLANAELNSFIKENEVDPEILIMGFVNLIEMLIEINDMNRIGFLDSVNMFAKYLEAKEKNDETNN